MGTTKHGLKQRITASIAGVVSSFALLTGVLSAGMIASQTASVAAAPLASCSTVTTLKTTQDNLSDWDFSQTRSAGHYSLDGNGLKIYTDTDVTGSPDPRKVAGYHAANFPLTGLGSQTIDEALDYTTVSGIEPGLQLVVDYDGNGTPDGILVGEKVYGENWWLTNGSSPGFKAVAPHVGGGNGSDWYGTAEEWTIAAPNARVLGIGFSLGSGVNGSGVINSITLGCTKYTFQELTYPTTKDDCKNGGWVTFTGKTFKNQGDCVSSIASNGKAKGNPVQTVTTFLTSIF